jgi:hypothetical protein
MLAAVIAMGTVGALALTGCTSGAQPSGGPSANGSTPIRTLPSTPGSTDLPPGSSTTGSTSSSAGSTTAGPSSSPNPPGVRACALPDLTIEALRGAGISQHQYATITVQNSSSTQCRLNGFLGIQLIASGRTLGPPAIPAGGATSIVLKPDAQAEVELSGPSNCNAGVSDHVRITPPGADGHVDRELPLRGCPLTVGPYTS